MIYLQTGQPGAGKTLNTIKLVDQDETFKNRPVYYYNIRGLTLPWNQLSKEEVQEWYNLPEGAVIVIDECQEFFPAGKRRAGDEVPQIIAEMNTHRHKGYDLFLITQHHMLLDTAVRRVVGTHRHYERIFGSKRVKCLNWQKCANDPDDFHKRKESEIKQESLDKEIFNLYESAEIHTHKATIPKKLYLLVALVLGFLFVVGYFANRIMGMNETPGAIPESTPGVEAIAGLTQQPRRKGLPASPEEYANLFTPRIASLPYTAPIYDELMEPKDFPKPNCVLSEARDFCQCYSQQATKMDVSKSMCKHIVENGWFDFTREPPKREGKPKDPYANAVAALPQRRTGLLHIAEHDTTPRRLDNSSRAQQALLERSRRRAER